MKCGTLLISVGNMNQSKFGTNAKSTDKIT